MDIKIVLDIILGFLLVGTSFYLWMLNKRLSVLRKNRDEMAKLIAQFNEATVRADTSIPKLRQAAEAAGQALQERVEKAQSLRDDLAFMIERADSMADRLEGAVRAGRNEMKAAPKPAAAPAAAPPQPQPQPQPQVQPAMSPRPAAAAAGSLATAAGGASPLVSPATAAAVTAALQTAKGVAGTADLGPDAAAEDERSEAERELLRALQSVR